LEADVRTELLHTLITGSRQLVEHFPGGFQIDRVEPFGETSAESSHPMAHPVLDEVDAAAAVPLADHLAHQHRTRGPFATKDEAVQRPQDEELLEILGKGAKTR